GKAPTQCLPFNVLHDDEKFVLFVDDVVNCCDVRIAEARGPFRFLPKSLPGTLVTTEVRRDALESHLTLQTKITCTVDFAHATFAKQFLDRKSSDDCSAQIASRSHGDVGLHAGLGHWKKHLSASGRLSCTGKSAGLLLGAKDAVGQSEVVVDGTPTSSKK